MYSVMDCCESCSYIGFAHGKDKYTYKCEDFIFKSNLLEDRICKYSYLRIYPREFLFIGGPINFKFRKVDFSLEVLRFMMIDPISRLPILNTESNKVNEIYKTYHYQKVLYSDGMECYLLKDTNIIIESIKEFQKDSLKSIDIDLLIKGNINEY